MPNFCEICNKRLRGGRGGNIGACSVCSIHICNKCEQTGFCPTHFQALSPRGQTTVKLAFYIGYTLIIVVFFLVIFLAAWWFGPVYHSNPWIPFILAGGDIALLFLLNAARLPWLRSIWRHDTGQAVPAPTLAVWECNACGFENPISTQNCGQCGRPKFGALRIA